MFWAVGAGGISYYMKQLGKEYYGGNICNLPLVCVYVPQGCGLGRRPWPCLQLPTGRSGVNLYHLE